MTDFDLRVPMLCTKILEAIENEPGRFDMSSWRDDRVAGRPIPAEEVIKSDSLNCDTVMCLAGWAVHMVPDKLGYKLEHKRGLSVAEVAERVFRASGVSDEAMEIVEGEEEEEDADGNVFVQETTEHVFFVNESLALTWLREQSAREKAEASK